jgi:hypothetical protein
MSGVGRELALNSEAMLETVQRPIYRNYERGYFAWKIALRQPDGGFGRADRRCHPGYFGYWLQPAANRQDSRSEGDSTEKRNRPCDVGDKFPQHRINELIGLRCLGDGYPERTGGAVQGDIEAIVVSRRIVESLEPEVARNTCRCRPGSNSVTKNLERRCKRRFSHF